MHLRHVVVLGLLAAFAGGCSTLAPEPQAGVAVADVPPGGPPDFGMEPAYTPDPFEDFARHAFPDFSVSVELPEAWQVVEAELARVEGGSGFVNLNAADTDSGLLADMCEAEAKHQLQPYGSRPAVDPVTVDGLPACRILPSEDQPSEGNQWGAVIVEYHEPLSLNGATYRFLLVTADLPHLQAIIDSLQLG